MDEGYSFAPIADKVKCSHSCVSRTLLRVKKKKKEIGTLKDRKRRGRPRISSSREDMALAQISNQNRRLTSKT